MRLRIPDPLRWALPVAAIVIASWIGAYSIATFRASRLQSQASALLPLAAYDEAVRIYDRARGLTPTNATLSRDLGTAQLLMYAFRGEEAYATKAVEAMRAAVELNPLDARNYTELGWTLMTTQRLDEAELAFRKALELDPFNVHNIYSLGRLYEQRGEVDAAIRAYERALEIREVPEIRARYLRAVDAR